MNWKELTPFFIGVGIQLVSILTITTIQIIKSKMYFSKDLKDDGYEDYD